VKRIARYVLIAAGIVIGLFVLALLAVNSSPDQAHGLGGAIGLIGGLFLIRALIRSVGKDARKQQK
jgi:hypothetical protein